VEVPNITWEDIGGLDDVKRELQELVQVMSSLNQILLTTKCSQFNFEMLSTFSILFSTQWNIQTNSLSLA